MKSFESQLQQREALQQNLQQLSGNVSHDSLTLHCSLLLTCNGYRSPASSRLQSRFHPSLTCVTAADHLCSIYDSFFTSLCLVGQEAILWGFLFSSDFLFLSVP